VQSSSQTNIQFFLQVGYPSCRPTNSVKTLKGKIPYSMDLLTPSSPGGLPTLSLTTNRSWLPWERVAVHLISPLMPVPLSSSTSLVIIYDCCRQSVSWYLQLQLICNRWSPRKHLSNSTDEEPEPDTNPKFWVLSHL